MLKRLLVTGALAGCAIFATAASRQHAVLHPTAPPPVAGPTFSNEVVRVFQQNCQSCHHPGDIAPFSLMTYADAKPQAFNIKYMVQTHQMPPWKPTASCGDFTEPRVLSQADIDTIVKWVDNGAPEGNRADLPPQREFAGGWALGQPDMIFQSDTAFTPPASGDEYRCYSIPTNTTSDTYVSAIDVRPGDAKTVHHVIAYIDTTGESARLDAADPKPGYQCFGGPGFSTTSLGSSGGAGVTLGGWAPGSRPAYLPNGIAYLLPAASRLVLQVHYHAHDGNPKPDQTQFAVYVAKQKPSKLLRVLPLINQSFTIPPNDSNYRVSAQFTVPFVDTHIVFVAPHMHLLGKKMHVTATLPNGQQQCLVNIDDWDFNWQGLYFFKQPVATPQNTKFAMEAFYDNSSTNFRNPNNPPKPVSWGEATTDEMAIAFIGFTIDSENLASGKPATLVVDR